MNFSMCKNPRQINEDPFQFAESKHRYNFTLEQYADFNLAHIIEKYCDRISGLRKTAIVVEGRDPLSPWLIIGFLGT